MRKLNSFEKLSLIKKILFQVLLVIVFLGFNKSNAQITQQTNWTKAYDGTQNVMTGVSFPVATGANRILVVAISHTAGSTTNTQANPTTISYGGTTLALATSNGATAGRMHTWLYFLKDNAVMNGTSRPLNVTLPGTSHLNITVWYAVFAGVDQTPLTYTTGNGFNNTVSSGPAQLSAAMAVNASQQAIYMSSIISGNQTAPGYTINTNWSLKGSNGATNNITWKYDVANRTIPLTNTTDNAATSTITPAGNIRYAMSSMSLPEAATGTPIFTISNPTTAVVPASVCGSSLNVPIHAFNIGSTVSAGTLTNFQFTTSGTYVAADLTNYKILWNTTNTLGTATLLATNATPGGQGVQTFTPFSLSIPSGSTYFFWITADIATAAVTGHTLTVSGSAAADMTTTATKAGGPTTASGTQTLNASPTAVTVSGGGNFCSGTTTLTATGGVGGTIYYQGTTANGTSTLTPSTSQVIAASGTYYFRALNAGCWGTEGSAVVSIGAPTITLGANPAICQGLTAANLTYSLTTGTPNQYSIVYSAAAIAQGFINVTNAALPASPIVLFTPAGALAGAYNFNLTVRNSTSGCVSATYAKTVTLSATPATPIAITGSAIQLPSTAGLTYGIAAVTYATTYTWTVPTGWVITAGQGTTGITVTSGTLGQNGNITVTAGNACGTSAASIKAVSVSVTTDPHNNVCNQCHINHSAPAGALTAVVGNANLCISCHNPAGSASAKPFANADKAIPGVSGTSHAWDKNAVNATYQTNAPSNAAMNIRLASGQIICSVCHDQHVQTYPPYLRADNTGDAICKDCHSARNLGRYIDNPTNNKSSHPVGLTYNIADERFLPAPVAPVVLVNGKTECSSCHKTHNAGSTDGNILRMANNNNLCTSCHVTMTHNGASCNTCHQTHNTNKSNIYLIRDVIATPNSGNKPVVFTAESGAGSFADGAAPYNGVCEVCHTDPLVSGYHLNNSPGTHNNGVNCTSCHKHANAFRASCFDCHNTTQGTRRQIVDNTGNGLGTGGDFKRTSHHVTGAIPKESDCILCHEMSAHKGGTVRLKDDLGNVYPYNPANKATVEGFCINCHDANGFNGDLTPLSDGVTVPLVNSTMWAASAHKTAGTANANTCLACHDNGHGSNKSTLIGPADYTGPGTGTDLMNEEEGFCLSCHGAGGAATAQVHLSFANNANTATAFRKHDPTASYRKHTNEENTGAAFAGANRHVECSDCHNPHGAKVYAATVAPVIYNELIGTSGVTPTYAGAGAPTGFTFNKNTTYEYEVCFKCHSSFTTLPTYLPAGWTGTADQADALRKITTAGTNTQIADSRDMAQEYNPANTSYHPVMAAGTNLNINVNTFQTGYTFTSRIYCSSCHDNTQKATAGYGRGPHGSQNLHILDAGTGGNAGYKTTHNGVNTAATDFCTKCHKATSYITGNTNSRYAYHLYHVAGTTKEGCYVCHDTHGSEQFHLINFSRNQAPTNCITSVGTNTQAAFAHANGTAANTCTVTCHGTSHGGGKSYNPGYLIK